MTQFQVYLPPTNLVHLTSLKSTDLPLIFQTIPRPPSFTFQSSSQSLETPLLGPPLLPPATVHDKARASKRRKVGTDLHDDAPPFKDGNGHTTEAVAGAGDESRFWAEKGGSPSWDLSRVSLSGKHANVSIDDYQDEQYRRGFAKRAYPLRTQATEEPIPTSIASRRKSHRLNPGAFHIPSPSLFSFFPRPGPGHPLRFSSLNQYLLQPTTLISYPSL